MAPSPHAAPAASCGGDASPVSASCYDIGMNRSLAIAASVWLVSACSDPLVITCDPARRGAECLQGGISGECVATCDDSAHYCAFSAPHDCPETGLAYGALSGSYSETCVETCALAADGGTGDGAASADAGTPCEARIAFSTGRDSVNLAANIFTMRLDGSDQKRVSLTDGLFQNPIWSPDGRSILFTCDFGVCTIRAEGSVPARLTPAGGNFEWPGSWTPDGLRIVYTDAEPSPSTKSDVWIMNADGSEKVRLTATGAESGPRVSPDGSKISFTSKRDGNFEIYVMNIDGSLQTNLSRDSANDSIGAAGGIWSPDGSEVLFVSDRDPNIDLDIFAVPAAGGDSHSLSNLQYNDSQPSWSPGGDRIAWQHGHGINVMNADGSGQFAVTNGMDHEDSSPVWTDATHLVFVRYSGQNTGGYDLFGAEAKPDAPVVRLTSDPSGELQPAVTACAGP